MYIKNATVVYHCSKVINRLKENKSGLQTKTEVTTSTIRGKQRNNRNTEYFPIKYNILDRGMYKNLAPSMNKILSKSMYKIRPKHVQTYHVKACTKDCPEHVSTKIWWHVQGSRPYYITTRSRPEHVQTLSLGMYKVSTKNK